MSSVSSRRHLDRGRVVDTAIALADESGLDGASMRSVSEALGVTPMALYKHVANRAQLIDEMLDTVLKGMAPPVASGHWTARVRGQILAARAVLTRHPWAKGAIESRSLASDTALAHMDALMAAMFDGGLSADLVHHAMHALSTRMWGFNRDVLPTPTLPEDAEGRRRAMAHYAGMYPAIVRMATASPHAGVDCDEDAEFAFALDLLLDGIERLRVTGWTSPEPGGTSTRAPMPS